MGAILIVARNNAHLTKLAVRSALNQDVECHVLVIDNASTDSTSAWLKTKPCAYITHSVQLSLSACWNRGIKALFDIGSTEVLVLNNDVEIRSDMYRLLRDKGVPFVTGVSVSTREQMHKSTPSTEETRPHPDFSAFMIRPEVVYTVGGFNDEYYPAYCEDCDYHVRMHRAGIDAVCVDMPFYHAAAQTIKQADVGEQERIKRGAESNKRKFYGAYGCYPGTPEYQRLFEKE